MNTRQKKMLIVVGGGLLILVWRMYILIADYAPSKAAAGADPVAAEVTDAPPSAPPIDAKLDVLLKAQQERAGRPWGRDPFGDGEPSDSRRSRAPQSCDPAPPQPPNFALSGISRVGDDRRAIISGMIRKVGDDLEKGFKLVEIDSNQVVIESAGLRYRYLIGSSTPTLLSEGHTP